MSEPVERDPRFNPQPGDVFRTVKVTTKVVTSLSYNAAGIVVSYTCGSGKNNSLWLNSWRKWAATAEVISRGPE